MALEGQLALAGPDIPELGGGIDGSRNEVVALLGNDGHAKVK
jgi:hypothetical protein